MLHRSRSTSVVALVMLCGSTATAAPTSGCLEGGSRTSAAFPSYLAAWKTKYPTSTLPARMAALTGLECHVCHHPPNRSTPGNCYRDDIRTLLDQGLLIAEILDQLDGEDSDGDGVSNGVEATTPRPGGAEVGYNMGLVGDTGTDPCAVDPGEAVTGESETPAIEPVPTVSQWGIVIMMLGVVTVGTIVMPRRRRDCCAVGSHSPR